jgi:hypothetical protein
MPLVAVQLIATSYSPQIRDPYARAAPDFVARGVALRPLDLVSQVKLSASSEIICVDDLNDNIELRLSSEWQHGRTEKLRASYSGLL